MIHFSEAYIVNPIPLTVLVGTDGKGNAVLATRPKAVDGDILAEWRLVG